MLSKDVSTPLTTATRPLLSDAICSEYARRIVEEVADTEIPDNFCVHTTFVGEVEMTHHHDLKARDNATQIGSVGGNVSITTKISNIGIWGCLSAVLVTTVVGIVAFSIVTLIIGNQSTAYPPSGVSTANLPVATIQTQDTPLSINSSCDATHFSSVDVSSSSTLVSYVEADPEINKLIRGVKDYIIVWSLTEVQSYQNSDDRCLAEVLAGEALEAAKKSISDLRERGLVFDLRVDLARSILQDIRPLGGSALEFDLCRYQGGAYYDTQQNLIRSESEKFIAWTGTIKGSPWRITKIQLASSALCK